ncbi:MAG: zinc ribbon domain-containing protein [Ruminococcus sp.]|nr:zinc ribbon domain-containing protein [Ruminococcus sp.]
MICPNCGYQNRDDAKFCRSCGKFQTASAPVPVPAAPVPEAVIPVPQKKKIVPKTRRLRWILLTLFFIALTDGVLGAGLRGTLMRNADTRKYSFKEFSISMHPDLIIYKMDSFEMHDIKYNSYVYYASDGTQFIAAISDHCSDDDLSFAADNPSATTRELFSQYLRMAATGPQFNGEYFAFFTNYEGKRCCCTAREIIENGRVYSFCFISPKNDPNLYKSWLKTIKIISE